MPRNGLGRAKRVEVAPPVREAGPDITTRLLGVASVMLTPPWRMAAMTLGGATLLARGIGLVLDAAAQEGEIQLTRATASIVGMSFRWWG
jgi:hypothetical protein